MITPCPESFRVQDFLDDELVPAEREAFEAHLAGCARCEMELAGYRRVFAHLEALEMWDPGPQLAERVLAEVMPRRAGRWVPVLAWTSGLSVVGSFAAIAISFVIPGPRTWMSGLLAEATQSVVSSLLFLLKSISAGAVSAFDGVRAFGPMLGRLGVVLRAMAASTSHPFVAIALWSALLVGVALLYWMRPKEHRSIEGDRHVGLLGF